MTIRFYLLLLLLSGPIQPSRAQTTMAATTSAPAGSEFDLAKPTAQQVENLTVLGQVWGFLKYYHPAVAAGKRDWDAELFKVLPTVLASRNTTERSATLSSWITELGPVPACATCADKPSQPVRVAPDLRWLADKKNFSPALSQLLTNVAANRYQGEPYYVGRGNAASPAFPHEEAYAAQLYPNTGLRLLALYRYWNIVAYFFPYKYAVDTDWQQILPKYIPRFLGAGNALEYRQTALALFTDLHDSHATVTQDPVLSPLEGDYIVAAAVQFIQAKALVIRVRHDGQVVQPPLEPGDRITEVDGVSVDEWVTQRLPRTPGSNKVAQLRSLAIDLLRGSTPEMQVKVTRAGKSLTLTAPRFKLGTVPPVKPAVGDSTYQFLTPKVGYVNLATITRAKLPTIMQAFQQTDGIVFDLRNYPGEFVTNQLLSYFISQPTVFAKFAAFDARYPGRFVEYQPKPIEPAGSTPYAGRVAVLVNEATLSQGEYTAMALRAAPRATILGSQTGGADGDISRIVLPGNLVTRISGTGVYYPDGRETQRVGIVPDIEVHPTAEGLRNGKDEVRDKAVQLVTATK
ncbi:S41 family peptidase [uncultured Hymenobacter sp.]|uniref:S41 family peptidase n=1 Tax=uncultured Hymenobacter sp. TaxID=170016 RepID=UPI0035CB0BC4